MIISRLQVYRIVFGAATNHVCCCTCCCSVDDDNINAVPWQRAYGSQARTFSVFQFCQPSLSLLRSNRLLLLLLSWFCSETNCWWKRNVFSVVLSARERE